MKTVLSIFFFLFTVLGIAGAQAPEDNKSAAPARPVTNQPAGDPAVAEAQQTMKRFSLQSTRLREAYSAKDAATISAFYPGTLLTMRQAIEQLEKQRLVQIQLATAGQPKDAGAAADKPVAAAAPTVVAAEKLVVRSREILAAFEGFEFNTDKTQEADAKFALLAEFQRLMQENLSAMKKK